MKTLKTLPKNGLKPISREAIARCIEMEYQDMNPGSRARAMKLASMVRADTSFDVAIPTSWNFDKMKVNLYKYNGEIPLYDVYCGHAIEKALAQLPYNNGCYEFSSAVRIRSKK